MKNLITQLKNDPTLQLLQRFWNEEDAPTTFEYALIIAGVAAVVGVAATALFAAVAGAFNRGASSLK